MALSIYFLGTGSDYPTKYRESICVYIKAFYKEGHSNILFDCSPNILSQLDKLYIAPEEIDAVILSHKHWAHCAGIIPFIWANAIFGRTRPLYIICPDIKELKELKDDFEKHYPETNKHRKKFDVKFISLKCKNNKEVFNVNLSRYFPNCGKINLAYAQLPHTEGVPSFGYALTFEEWLISERKPLKISYIVDAKVDEQIEVKLVDNSTVLIHDCSFESEAIRWAEQAGHPTSQHIAGLLTKIKISSLFLVHIHPTRQPLKDEIKDRFRRVIRNSFDEKNPLIIPEDLDVYDLHSLVPERPEYSQKSDFSKILRKEAGLKD